MSPFRIRAFAGCALIFVMSTHGDARAAGKREAERPFVEATRIAAPKQVGEFTLEGTRFDEETKENGAQIRYSLSAHPDIRFDLFVFPAGEMPQEKAVARAVEEFVGGLEGAQRQGYFEDLRILDTADFRIEPARTSDVPEAAADHPLVEALLTPDPIVGKRLDLRYRSRQGREGETTPMMSRGYLFHKQLYYFKGRITVPAAQIAPEEFASLSDRAMRELVPAVVVSNVGECAEVTIAIPRDAIDKKDDTIGDLLMSQLGGAMAQQAHRNCYRSRAEARAAEPDNADVVTIEYDADDWGDP
jgi:hypothetical protein